MTIVLQHQFWDLRMDEEARLISVGLSFGGIASTLVIPLAALTAFADPQVRYGLRFQVTLPDTKPAPGTAPALAPAPAPAPAPALGPASAKPAPAKPAADPPAVPATQQVVSLDAFRRRTPPKD
jgi:hypothetical protein